MMRGFRGRDLAAALMDLVAVTECVGCGDAGASICPSCFAALRGPAICDTVLGVGRVCSAGAHAGPLGRAVVAYKEAGRRPLAGLLSEQLTKAVAASLLGHGWSGAGPVFLVPIPTRAAARRARGGDTLAAVARRSARSLRDCGVPVRCLPLLSHSRATGDQVGLSGPGRRANMLGAFRAAPAPAGLLILVDDVITTGATLAAAACALRAASPTGRGGTLAAATITTAHERGGGRRGCTRWVPPELESQPGHVGPRAFPVPGH